MGLERKVLENGRRTNLRRVLMGVLGSVAVVIIGLTLVLGVFWVLNLAPLLLFMGAAAVYVVLSSRQSKGPTPGP